MSNEVMGRLGGGRYTDEFEIANECYQENAAGPQNGPETADMRATRAKLIEEITYRLTDLFTIVSARIELLGDRLSPPCREELTAIRKVLLHGVELNRRLHLVAEACRRGSSVQK